MSRKYKFHETLGAYFISFATVNWIDVFTREIYFSPATARILSRGFVVKEIFVLLQNDY